MAVTLSSDLILDVMRAADPARRSEAAARLRSLDGGQGQRFAGVLDSIETAPSRSEAAGRAAAAPPSMFTDAKDGTSAHRGFERMVLRNLFETLLPEDDSGAFGGGPSAGIWRSMAADQLAGVYSEAGGIGIARMLSSHSPEAAPLRAAQWPYFAVPSIGAFTG